MSKNKKLFSLIHGDSIHVAPKTKILPSENYSELLSSKELLEKTKEDAEAYIKQVTKESEKIKETAEEEGFQNGMKQWASHVASLEKEIQKVHGEVAKLVIPVALKAAKKIIGRELELSKDTVVDIVISNLKAISHHKNIKIYVCKEDVEVMEKNKEKLKGVFEALDSLLIIESDDVDPGGSIIETEGGIINAQLENLWQKLESAFESMSKSKT